MIHKTFLFHEDRLKTGSNLTQPEKEKLALQLSKRRKDSDAYGLIPLLNDPIVSTIIVPLLLQGLITLTGFAAKRAFAKRNRIPLKSDLRQAELPPNSKLILLVFPQASEIVNRIDNISGIEVIELFGEPSGSFPKVTFNASTKQDFRNMETEPFLGEIQEIQGSVKKLYQNTNVATISTSVGDVKVYLDRNNFDTIRYKVGRDTIIKFSGRPRFRWGTEFLRFEEFEAYGVTWD